MPHGLSLPADAAYLYGAAQEAVSRSRTSGGAGRSASCQWALFLRNHDELTLEMVTDVERDYLYLAYAPTPRRASMSAFVAGSRRLWMMIGRRIELINRLLCLFPARRSPRLFTGMRCGWATTSISAIATACARRCNGAPIEMGDSLAPTPLRAADHGPLREWVNVEAQRSLLLRSSTPPRRL